MSDSLARDEGLKQVGGEILDVLVKIADAAARHARDSSDGVAAMASVNTFTSTRAILNFSDIAGAMRAADVWLTREPAIARVVAVSSDGRLETFYVCRATPPTGVGIAAKVASYRSPLGRLAALPVGETLLGPSGELEVVERSHIHPQHDGAWDSRQTTFESASWRPITVESLRELIRAKVPSIDEGLLEQLLAEETAGEQIFEGMRRSVLTKMGLRDQPILDQYQDEIFRSPLKRQLLLLGPPGTGKTTTLIRRLGQKLDRQFLDDGEIQLVDRVAATTGLPAERSWVLFTPTELLKQYVREAFAREGIAAPDDRIHTWADHRRYLARNVFGVLRTATRGAFVLKGDAATLATTALPHVKEWCEDFLRWNVDEFRRGLLQAADYLAASQATEVSELGQNARRLVAPDGPDSIEDVVVSLTGLAGTVQSRLDSMKASSDAALRQALNLEVNRNGEFLDQLVSYLESLREADAADVEDDEDRDIEEEEEGGESHMPRIRAVQAFSNALRAYARAGVTGRKLPASGRYARIIQWLGARVPPDAELSDLGARLMLQANLRRLASPAKRYLEGTARRYRAFRRARQKEGVWYNAHASGSADIHPLELDLLLFSMLRGASRLADHPEVRANLDQSAWNALRPFVAEMRSQVLVDEATDFSPVQLGCMYVLAHPDTRSFFACGDFNQRLTIWGSRTSADVEWAVTSIESQTVAVGYRQSSQLNQLSAELIRLGGGVVPEVRLPENVENQGVPPLLAEGLRSIDDCAGWLATRIGEVERLVQTVPSIAVLVPQESLVQAMADALNSALAETSIRAVACLGGQALGQDLDVRVFDIQHVKGLEFEAVFFVDIDRLAEAEPELFDKYLYVGTSRAAVYLGMTCNDRLPAGLETLRTLFAERWDASMLGA